jgi:hypothetical protein
MNKSVNSVETSTDANFSRNYGMPDLTINQPNEKLEPTQSQ